MTTSSLRLTLIAASAIALSACQHLPDFLKPSPSSDTTAQSTAATQGTATAGTPSGSSAPVPATATVVNSQNAWWDRLKVGTLQCAQGATIGVDRLDSQREVAIDWKNKKYVLQKVATTTGAYRYEDKASGLTLVQIPTKTILLNTKVGERLADECNNGTTAAAAPAAAATASKTASSAKARKSSTKTTVKAAAKRTTKSAAAKAAKK